MGIVIELDDLRCEYCGGPLGTPERLCCADEWSPSSIGFYRAWQQGLRRWDERPPVAADWFGWCCGRWLPHFADIEAHLRDMHNVQPAR